VELQVPTYVHSDVAESNVLSQTFRPHTLGDFDNSLSVLAVVFPRKPNASLQLLPEAGA